ncbi:MAG: hypothetical protein AB7R89_28205 [Dehalococcoidia bacterium]
MTADAPGEVGVDDVTGHPLWVLRQGIRRIVTAIEADRWEPARRLVRVRLDSGEHLLLIQRRDDRRWSVTPASPPFGPTSA